MLTYISILIGVLFFGIGSLLLWHMLARPKEWKRFTEKEMAFWVRRGFPVKWAGACKTFEQGRGLMLLVGFCIVVAFVLAITPFFLPVLFHHHA